MTLPERIVVIGHGMVAARFLDELQRQSPPLPTSVTVLAEECHAPYNRLLLAEVLSGEVELASLTLPDAPAAVTVHRGRAAVRIDRPRRTVIDAAGDEHPYDLLVLATGAAARIPGLGGDDELPPGVHPLRTLDDCRAILRASRGATRAVVIGGGLLGVEAAVGLTARGLAVTVVHAGPHTLDRQLDGGSAHVAQGAMADIGLRLVNGHRPQSLVCDGIGRIRAVRLADGEELPADLVVMAVGVTPRVDLAREAGLPVDRGVLVGDDLRSPVDPAVAAIGDCAQPPEGCPGLLAPGYDQARRLAAAIAGEAAASTRHPGEVVRVKAANLDIVTLGQLPDEADARVISLVDHQARRSLRVAIEGRRIVGAVLVGAGPVAADLTVAFERGTPVPDDPALLLLPGAAALLVPSDTDEAIVCTCNRVTAGQIKEACRAGHHSVAEVACATRATTGCGGCLGAVRSLLSREVSNQAEPSHV